MTLAVVTVTLNNLHGIRQTVESLDAQSSPPDQHWIIDGGSTDGTLEYLAALPTRPGRRFLSESDNGIFDAMNKGTALATADFIWFLNAGDTCAGTSAIARIRATLATPAATDGLYAKVWFKSSYGLRSVGGPVKPDAFRSQMPVCHQGIIYSRAALLANPYPAGFRLISDWIVTRSLFERGARFAYLDEHIAVYDLGGVSSRSHFAIVREKIRYETRLAAKLRIAIVCGVRAGALHLSKITGLHHVYKRRQHARHPAPRLS